MNPPNCCLYCKTPGFLGTPASDCSPEDQMTVKMVGKCQMYSPVSFYPSVDKEGLIIAYKLEPEK